MALKTLAETATAVITASIVASIVAYLVVDALRTGVSERYREARLARHDALCFSLYDPETSTGDPQAELQRQMDLPRSFLGKIELFFLCSRLTELELAGAKLQHAENLRTQQIRRAQEEAAETTAANIRAEIDELLAALPPRTGAGQIELPGVAPPQTLPDWQGNFGLDFESGQRGTGNSITGFAPLPDIAVGPLEDSALQSRIDAALERTLADTLRQLDEEFDPGRYSIAPEAAGETTR